MSNKTEKFWHIRSANYDKLFWTKDEDYLNAIIRAGHFKKSDLVLDVGTGTGIVAKKIKPLVKHVVGIDISGSMLEKGSWEGVSVVNGDIRENLFADNLFDKIIARMVFHHILYNLNGAISQCYEVLKKGGRLVVAEGVPPSDDREIVNWYSSVFKLKEKRRTFTNKDLVNYLKKNGFKNIQTRVYMIDNFSIKNWLRNSGLPISKQHKIMQLHIKANKKIKDVYQMKITKNDCLIRTKNIIITGEK